LAIPKEVSREIEIIVMNPDIDVDSSNDGIISDNEDFIEEIAPGKIIGYNGDDDNNNKTVDANEATSVVGEDDLAIMSLTFQQNHLPNGYKIVLQATEGAGNIKVWDSATKGSEVALETPLIVGQHTIPSLLYIEGMQSGEAVLRVVLKSDKDEELCDDKIRLTVYKIEILTPDSTPMNITAEPKMPEPIFKTQISPSSIPLADITFKWHLVLKFNQHGRNDVHRVPEDPTMTDDIVGNTDWTPEWGDLFAGGYLKAYVRACYKSTAETAHEKDGYKIMGTNPSKAQILAI
ncbi:MAG: hypothetical protein GY839_17940, partial [candidate division Zixibacteria bacterium]|nr:hypothetical protein [candidate division Zixibacteria bacterium]